MTEPPLYDPKPHTDRTWTIYLQPDGAAISAGPGQTVLQAALCAGLALPSACRNGTCRACLSRLVAGEIRYLIEWPGLSAEEKSEGYFLPCVACPQTDIVMETALA